MLICASVNDTVTMHVGKSVLQQEALLFVNIQQQNQQVYHSLCLNFDVSLTVHLSIFISVINQLDAQNFCFTISLFHASTCFEHVEA